MIVLQVVLLIIKIVLLIAILMGGFAYTMLLERRHHHFIFDEPHAPRAQSDPRTSLTPIVQSPLPRRPGRRAG